MNINEIYFDEAHDELVQLLEVNEEFENIDSNMSWNCRVRVLSNGFRLYSHIECLQETEESIKLSNYQKALIHDFKAWSGGYTPLEAQDQIEEYISCNIKDKTLEELVRLSLD